MDQRWHLRRVMVAWLEAKDRPDQVHVMIPDDRDPTTTRIVVWPVADILDVLRDDDAAVPDRIAATLQLPPHATFGHIVARLDHDGATLAGARPGTPAIVAIPGEV